MKYQFSPGFKLWISTSVIFLSCLLSPFYCIAQTSNDHNPDICKQLAIESAQLANESYSYSQKIYFGLPNSVTEDDNTIDSALIFIHQSIVLIDSAIALADDSSVLGIEYANIAKDYAINSYHDLIDYQNSRNGHQRNSFLKNAASNLANTTVEAYKASFYFKGVKKTTTSPPAPTPIKQITKLDIDQTLFTILKEDLQQKKEMNSQELSKLLDELSKTNEPVKQAELKSQIKKLELKQKEFDKKGSDTEQKLTSINTLIEERAKNGETHLVNEETVFSKSIIKTTDEWNKQIKFDEEILPDGLVYQVQLGVYKNPILPEVFRGLTPIYGKNTDNGISYATGLFEKLVDAKEAKNYVIELGFADAFIVAFHNKKKIPLDEAIKLEK